MLTYRFSRIVASQKKSLWVEFEIGPGGQVISCSTTTNIERGGAPTLVSGRRLEEIFVSKHFRLAPES
jgi:hypothetical protein